MKRVLGIILAVLGCIILFSLFVLVGVADGLTLGASILVTILAIVIALLISGWVKLVVWLLY